METTDTRLVRLIVLVALLTSGATGWSNVSAGANWSGTSPLSCPTKAEPEYVVWPRGANP